MDTKTAHDIHGVDVVRRITHVIRRGGRVIEEEQIGIGAVTAILIEIGIGIV